MIKLVIIADDFTGALDTGAQFSAAGIRTKVIAGFDYPEDVQDIQVLVFNTESRHEEREIAYSKVYAVAQAAIRHQVPYILKKTDSGLRGNIGAELEALLDASGEDYLPFLPAYPQLDRVTKGGIHYINGTPVAESVFGFDPIDPVEYSRVTEIIEAKTDKKARSIGRNIALADGIPDQKKEILIFDIESLGDLHKRVSELKNKGMLHIMAGCAGLASVLPDMIALEKEADLLTEGINSNILVACGTVNPISVEQMDVGEANGYYRVRLTDEEKLAPGYWESEKGRESISRLIKDCKEHDFCILDTNDVPGSVDDQAYAVVNGLTYDQVRKRIPKSMGHVLKMILDEKPDKTLFIVGGDTLMGFLSEVHIKELDPVCELLPGTILSSYEKDGIRGWLISKSGGFGDKQLLIELKEKIKEMR